MKRLGIFLIFLLTFLGCGNDARVDSGSIPRLSAFIHFVPAKSYGISYLQFPSVRTKDISQGEAGQFVAEIRVGGNTVPDNLVSDYIQNFIWTIDGKDFISSSVSRTFPDSGIFDVTLRTVDFFNDTLADTLTIFVTSELEVFPVSPENGYAKINPFDSVLFEVKTEGINSWQDAACTLYLSSERSSLWNSPIDTIPCNGSRRESLPKLPADSTHFRDTSYTFYWAVSAKVPDSENAFDTDSSEVYTFHTTLLGTEASRLTVPVRYRSLSPSLFPHGEVLLQKANGDTVARASFFENPATVRFSELSAGDSMRVSVRDSMRSEYGKKTVSFFLEKSTFTVLDTIVLVDTVPPLRTPKVSQFAVGDSVEFYIYDGGSGVSQNSVRVKVDGDTLSRTIRGNVVRFLAACKTYCTLDFSLRDYAGNSSSPVVWSLLRAGDSLQILGPKNPEDL